MNILVLGGGLSMEREVSLCSSTMVCNALIDSGHRAIMIDAYFGLPDFDGDFEALFAGAKKLPPYCVSPITPDLDLIKAQRQGGDTDALGLNVLKIGKWADMVYMGLHGAAGENGDIQSKFDSLGIRYTGSGASGCRLAMDKWQTKSILNDNGILSPKGCILTRGTDYVLDALPLPCVVKPCSGGSSIGTTIVHKREQLQTAIADALSFDQTALVEQYIKGREIAAGILGNIALPLIEILPKTDFYNYKNKYLAGLTKEITPAPVDERTTQSIQQAAKKVFELLGLEVYGRLDFILGEDGRVYCLEANTLPGMTPTSLLPQEAQAAGLSYPKLCCSILNLSMEKYDEA